MFRKAAMIGTTLTLTFCGIGVVSTSSGAESMTHCKFSHEPDLSPGLSFQESSGVFTDPGGGTVTCHGPINGHMPTGQGVYTDSGRYGTVDGDTCQGGGEAEGDPKLVIPTADGPQTITDHIMIKYGEPSTKGGIVHAEFVGEHSSGTIEITPTEGDCILNPITRFIGAGEMMLH